MSAHRKLIAKENTIKIENALRQIRNPHQTASDYDPTIYIEDDGKHYKTTSRIVSEVPPPTNEKPSNSKVFSLPGGLPDYNFLAEHFKREGKLSTRQVRKIIKMATEIFASEPNLLQVPSPVTVCGDIHGQYYDLMKLFDICGSPRDTSFLFLGDYVDRGSNSLEVLLLLYSMKIAHKDTFFMLRGNHETRQMTTHFTFKTECLLKYDEDVYEAALKSFAALPIAAIMNKQFLCVHGGLSRDLHTLADIDGIDRFVDDVPSRGLFCDLMWADPSSQYDTEEISEGSPLFKENYERGCSYTFPYKAVCRFLKANGLLCVIRAHQAQDAGYRMYKKTVPQQFPSVITLFSAPNYCGTYGNKAAVLKYDTAVMNIRQFGSQPEPYHLPDFMNVFTWSIPFVAERVFDILYSVLNICTEEELEQGTPLSKELAKSIVDVKKSRVTAASLNEAEGKTIKTMETSTLRNKILAIGRMSRMFNILREEAEKVEQLRSLSGGSQLPKGVLLGGSGELDRKLSTFEEARLADLSNEAMPPTAEEQKKEAKEKYEELVRRASESHQLTSSPRHSDERSAE
ncbi:DEKNAAC101050 [Brettanomyces naardenensis]|uniref:Serine/threonine-protein phosphatase n=1 Tax=Brettanomyces naardenensis TaxID=13370 RepID=A0A448YH36_BRENA|nr:DEKNAAC101050 [Brettanomyces naardenensis]